MRMRLTVEYEEQIGGEATVSLHTETEPAEFDVSVGQALMVLEMARMKIYQEYS